MDAVPRRLRHFPLTGALIIGQTPRPDLEAVLDLPDTVFRGALDLPEAIPENLLDAPVFPLRTRLADGTVVVVDEPFLAPLLQRQIDQLEREGATAIALLCAGPFTSLTSAVPLVHPFRLAASTFRAMGFRRLLVLVPIEAQRQPAERKWTKAGFQARVHVFPDQDVPAFAASVALQEAEALYQPDAVVFDYVGLPHDILEEAREHISVPVLDLGHLAAAVMKSLVASSSNPNTPHER